MLFSKYCQDSSDSITKMFKNSNSSGSTQRNNHYHGDNRLSYVNKEIRILLIEDEPSLIFTLRDTLENEGYIVIVCEDGEEAVS